MLDISWKEFREKDRTFDKWHTLCRDLDEKLEPYRVIYTEPNSDGRMTTIICQHPFRSVLAENKLYYIYCHAAIDDYMALDEFERARFGMDMSIDTLWQSARMFKMVEQMEALDALYLKETSTKDVSLESCVDALLDEW